MSIQFLALNLLNLFQLPAIIYFNTNNVESFSTSSASHAFSRVIAPSRILKRAHSYTTRAIRNVFGGGPLFPGGASTIEKSYHKVTENGISVNYVVSAKYDQSVYQDIKTAEAEIFSVPIVTDSKVIWKFLETPTVTTPLSLPSIQGKSSYTIKVKKLADGIRGYILMVIKVDFKVADSETEVYAKLDKATSIYDDKTTTVLNFVNNRHIADEVSDENTDDLMNF